MKKVTIVFVEPDLGKENGNFCLPVWFSLLQLTYERGYRHREIVIWTDTDPSAIRRKLKTLILQGPILLFINGPAFTAEDANNFFLELQREFPLNLEGAVYSSLTPERFFERLVNEISGRVWKGELPLEVVSGLN